MKQTKNERIMESLQIFFAFENQYHFDYVSIGNIDGISVKREDFKMLIKPVNNEYHLIRNGKVDKVKNISSVCSWIPQLWNEYKDKV